MTILSVKDLYYRADHTDILNGITLDVNQGDCICIVGASGSGKSTLLKICADLIPVTKGNLIYRDKKYESYDPLELRKNISYCVQLPYLFGDTVRDNLAFVYQIRKEKVNVSHMVELLEMFNLDETVLDKRVDSLSGGEKQRVALVRNLLFTPDILLLDEATSALDRENAVNVENYVAQLNQQGVTVLWITHSLEQSHSIFNKQMVIDQGKVVKVEVLS